MSTGVVEPGPPQSPTPPPGHRRCPSTIREVMEGIRVAIGQIGRARMVPPRTMKRYEARAASTATERRAIDTINAIYWTFLRDLFKTASALNRPQGCRLRDMQGRTEEGSVGAVCVGT